MYKLFIAFVIFSFILISGCSQEIEESNYAPQIKTYVIEEGKDNSIGAMQTFVIADYPEESIINNFEKDRMRIESEDRYNMIRFLADKEKQEEKRKDCYKRHDKNETEYYLEECEDLS